MSKPKFDYIVRSSSSTVLVHKVGIGPTSFARIEKALC